MSGYQTEAQRQALSQRQKIVVKCIEARGVKAADWGGTSDPYCEIRVKGNTQSYKTKTIKKTLNPFWNEEFTIPIDKPDTDILNIRVYDYDAVSSNDLLGEIEIPVMAFANKPPKEEWKQLMKKKGPTRFKPVKGEIRLGFSWVGANGQVAGAAAPAVAAAPVAAGAPQVIQVQYPAVAAPQYAPQYPAPQQYPQYPQYPQQPQYPQYPPQPQYSQYAPQPQYPVQYPPQPQYAPQYPPQPQYPQFGNYPPPGGY